MNSGLKNYADRFNAQTQRERSLIAISILVIAVFAWWHYHAEPKMAQIETKQQENQRIMREVEGTRAQVQAIRMRIAAGVHKEKEAHLAKLIEQLNQVEEELRVKTVELIDPEKMFQLMNELIYRDSRLTLLNLKRREVKPAIPVSEGDPPGQDPGIYRHVLEIEFSGKFLDFLRYMQSMEDLDWKLLWDEIEIVSEENSSVTVKVVISTLSTRKEWVGI
jgi:hypothetical protein